MFAHCNDNIRRVGDGVTHSAMNVPCWRVAAISVIHGGNAGSGAFAGKPAWGRRKKVVFR